MEGGTRGTSGERERGKGEAEQRDRARHEREGRVGARRREGRVRGM